MEAPATPGIGWPAASSGRPCRPTAQHSPNHRYPLVVASRDSCGSLFHLLGRPWHRTEIGPEFGLILYDGHAPVAVEFPLQLEQQFSIGQAGLSERDHSGNSITNSRTRMGTTAFLPTD